jgi:hypothetical protein
MPPLTSSSTQIINAPAGSEAMVLDIAKFHRTAPIRPQHKRWFVLQGPDGFYVEHCCPFGCSSSSCCAGCVSHAVVDIWQALGVGPIPLYEDDLAPFRAPLLPPPTQRPPAVPLLPPPLPPLPTFAYDRAGALELIKPTNMPWHLTKGQDFAPVFIYIGYKWDIANQTVSLPEEKRKKFLRRICEFAGQFFALPCCMKDVMKIHGSFCHITFIHPLGRSYLPAFSNFVSDFKGNKYTTRHPPPSLFSQLKWWREQLETPNVVRQLRARGPPVDHHLYVDASTDWGIGIKRGRYWDAWRGVGSWRSPSRHIGWLEAVALEFMVYAIEELGLHDANLIVHSDNQGVIGAFDKGRSRNFEMNLCVRRSHTVLAARNLTLDLHYIESAKNPADPISRGILLDNYAQRRCSFTLPADIAPYFAHV